MTDVAAAPTATAVEPELNDNELDLRHQADAEEQSSPAVPLIAGLEELLGKRVITYYSRASMRRPDIDPLYGLLQQMGRQKSAAFILQSPGGDADIAVLIASLLREYVDELHVYVPTYAASAATLICLGSDALWMGPTSELSPIDPQVPVDPRMIYPTPEANDLPWHEPQYMPAHAIRDFLEFAGVLETAHPKRFKVNPERLEMLVQRLNPWILGLYERADKVSRLYAKKGLTTYLLKTHDEPDLLAEKIVAELLDEYASHEAGILRGSARAIGIPVEDCPPDVWDRLEAMTSYYSGVLERQDLGRVMETSDGFHATPYSPRQKCSNCGELSRRQPDFAYCPYCGDPFSPQCSACKKDLSGDWKFCPRCGSGVLQESAATPNS